MVEKKYPLAPLVLLRRHRVDAAIRALSDALTERDAAEQARKRAEAAREDHERAAAQVRAAEDDALEQGRLRVGDLAVAGRWGLGVDGERQDLVKAALQARGREDQARSNAAAATARLVSRRVEAEIVEKDRARFVDKERSTGAAREEEALSEAWRSKG